MTDQPVASASLDISARADRLYDLVTDIAGMGRLSPECTGGKWLDGATGPVEGARFKGTNKRGVIRWSTTSTVVTADRGREFTFETPDSAARWSYRFVEGSDGSTVVTESRAMYTKRPAVARWFSQILLGGTKSHDDEVARGMLVTLHRLKAIAES